MSESKRKLDSFVALKEQMRIEQKHDSSYSLCPSKRQNTNEVQVTHMLVIATIKRRIKRKKRPLEEINYFSKNFFMLFLCFNSKDLNTFNLDLM